MYSETDLEAAVADGALTTQQAAAFRAYVASSRATPLVDEEHFRLITGFNDIFVTIAAVLLLLALAWIGQSIAVLGAPVGPSPFAGIFVAGAAWGLAEFFTRRRRMALPSILLLLAFVGGVFGAMIGLFASTIDSNAGDNDRLIASLIAMSAGVSAVAAWLHWRRFRVPITIAAGTAATVALVIALVLSATPGAQAVASPLALLCGLVVFAFAMWWDMSDPCRETRRADVAFWLHLLAAPLIVHPVFQMLGLHSGQASLGTATVVIAIYVALGVVALAIDRRALMVSALAYVLYALNRLFETFGAVSLNVALAALVIGSALLLLSAFWHVARASVVGLLPSGLRSRLPLLDRPTMAPARA